MIQRLVSSDTAIVSSTRISAVSLFLCGYFMHKEYMLRSRGDVSKCCQLWRHGRVGFVEDIGFPNGIVGVLLSCKYFFPVFQACLPVFVVTLVWVV